MFPRLIPLLTAAGGVAALVVWLTGGLGQEIAWRLPGADMAPPAVPSSGPTRLRGALVRGGGVPADVPGAWPRFRGKNFDNVSDEEVTLARSWPAAGPPVLWSIEVGEGHAGAAVRDGRVYLLDYDRQNQADALRCLSLADGQEIWRYSYPVQLKRNHGMSRTVPAVTENYVVAIGPKCHVTCLDAETGEFRWTIDLVGQYGTRVPPWYAGQCPLVEGGRVILGVGGPDVLMMAVDCQSGQVVWKTENRPGWRMTHSSVMPMQLFDRRTYVYTGSGGVVGVSAEDGRVLWETNAWKIRIATVPSPLIVDAERVFLSGGYGAGSMMLQLEESGPEITPRAVFRLVPEVFGSPQHTPILYKGYLYGIRPDQQLTCLDLEGNVVWTSGAANVFGPRGLGPYLIADGLIFVLSDEGVLTVAEASPAGYQPFAQAKVLDGVDCWGPMALVAGRLILRDLTRMVCLDVRAR